METKLQEPETPSTATPCYVTGGFTDWLNTPVARHAISVLSRSATEAAVLSSIVREIRDGRAVARFVEGRSRLLGSQIAMLGSD